MCSVRVSTEDQTREGFSLPEQKEGLRKLNIFRKKQKNITPIENDIDYSPKENKKDKDDFDISR